MNFWCIWHIVGGLLFIDLRNWFSLSSINKFKTQTWGHIFDIVTELTIKTTSIDVDNEDENTTQPNANSTMITIHQTWACSDDRTSAQTMAKTRFAGLTYVPSLSVGKWEICSTTWNKNCKKVNVHVWSVKYHPKCVDSDNMWVRQQSV